MTLSPRPAATAVDAHGPDPAERPATARVQEAGLTGRSPGQLMWRRFKRDRTGVISGFIVVFFFAVGMLAPVISWLYGKNPYTLYGQEQPGLLDEEFSYPVKPNGGIDGEFWFGIEPIMGRDVFTQLVYGIRTSLLIALAVTVLVVVTAILIGVTAGYLGGRTDYLLGRMMDLLLAFPAAGPAPPGSIRRGRGTEPVREQAGSTRGNGHVRGAGGEYPRERARAGAGGRTRRNA